jgi:dTDP-4-amino-4,6-dideoxygalactose transaminase
MKNNPIQRPPFLPFSAPSFDNSEAEELIAALNSGWITTGPRTREFEKRFAEYIGVDEAVATNSCTAALHLALAALNVGPGDAVITTPFTFAATANVVVHQRALPVFVDIDPATYNLSPTKLQEFFQQRCVWNNNEKSLRLKTTGHRVRAIIPVHYGGQPCEMDPIAALATRYNLEVIEDAAHAAGAQYHSRNVGTLGTMACFSFYANKNMTTGEGGMLTTNDHELANRVRVLCLHGLSKDAWKRYSGEGTWRYDVVDAGFKYNLTDLASALGLHQLRKLDGFIRRREELAKFYTESLRNIDCLTLPTMSPNSRSAWHLYPVLINSPSICRDEMIEELRKRDIGCSVHFIPLHLTSFYRQTLGYKRGDFPIAEQTFDQIMSLPLFPRMSDADAETVADEIRSILNSVHLAAAS